MFWKMFAISCGLNFVKSQIEAQKTEWMLLLTMPLLHCLSGDHLSLHTVSVIHREVLDLFVAHLWNTLCSNWMKAMSTGNLGWIQCRGFRYTKQAPVFGSFLFASLQTETETLPETNAWSIAVGFIQMFVLFSSFSRGLPVRRLGRMGIVLRAVWIRTEKSETDGSREAAQRRQRLRRVWGNEILPRNKL